MNVQLFYRQLCGFFPHDYYIMFIMPLKKNLNKTVLSRFPLPDLVFS